MQSRNKSLLKFQERLIKAAMQSPQREAMNLMGIIYSNLEEFIRIRIPMDGDIEECADALADTLDIFDYALRMKFPNLYMAQIVPIASKLKSFEDIETLFATISFNKTGCFINGLFYHSVFIARELAFNINPDYLSFELTKDQRDKLEDIKRVSFSYAHIIPFSITGSRLHVSVPPYLVRSDDIAVDVVNSWIQDQSQPYDCKVRFEQHYRSNNEAMDFNNFCVESVSDKNIVISFINPLFIHFDQIAKMILSNTDNSEALVYNNEIPPFYGLYYGSDFQGLNKPGRALLRTPFASTERKDSDHNAVIETILGALNRKYGILNYIKEYESAETEDARNEIVRRIKEGNSCAGYTITSAYMSIYRTDHNFDKANVEFLKLMAIMLQRNCHVFIEARARDDEQNNVNLANTLKELGASIHVQSYGFSYKVHAKIWHFHMLNPTDTSFDINVFSTGNFVSSAQNGFADTIVIEKTYSKANRVVSNFSQYLDYLYNPNQYTERDTDISRNSFIWKPGDIRQRLFDLIHYARRGQFIWIKCNHITDKQIIKELKAAAKRGVLIRLIVRTTCTIGHGSLRFNGIQQSFAARSIVGRYLEHDRWFIFGEITGWDEPISDTTPSYTVSHAYISSADLMSRNLDERVEFMYENEDTMKLLPSLFLDMYCKETSAEQGYFNISL